ncbi:MAG: ATP-binding cassette domain-containing protein [Methanobacteriaceae archaeon]|nr:ATP-binding cassette domain-containing protein [Methanobacteriaceae archaeon]
MQALKRISLEIRKGSLTVIVGPSGSGKSTFLKIAGLLEKPSQGSVVFKGNETKNLSPDERAHLIKENVGFILKKSNLLSYLTIMENVMLPMSNYDAQHALNILENLGLKHPDKFPSALSSLEKQKVVLARAIINQPAIIFGDEPTGSLNSTDTHEFLNLLLNFKDDYSMVIMTNDDLLASYADEVYYLRDGFLEKNQNLVIKKNIKLD